MGRMGFWSRIGAWFRSPSRAAVCEGPAAGDAPAAVSDGGTLATAREVGPEPAAGAESTPHPSRRGAAKHFEDPSDRVAALAETLDGHLERQEARAEAVAQSLDRIAEILTGLRDGTQTHKELLVAIERRLQTDGERTRQFEERLGELPQIADAQREAVALIGSRLEQSCEASDRIIAVLRGFDESFTVLGETVATSTAVMGELRDRAAAGEERIVHLVEEQTRRFTSFACVAIGVALVVATTGLVVLLR